MTDPNDKKGTCVNKTLVVKETDVNVTETVSTMSVLHILVMNVVS
jgi:hypothetical protein